MTIPVSFKIPSDKVDECLRWVYLGEASKAFSFSWPENVVTFENEYDATAFSLAFNCARHLTTVEKMLRYEEDNN